MSDQVFALFVLALVPLGWAFYLLPAIVAFRRQHPNRWLILAVNVMLGATGIGWAVALVWAFQAAHRASEPGGSHGGESGLNLFVNDIRTVRVLHAADTPVVAPASGPTLDTPAQRIERLNQLRAAEHVTETEFATLKAAVIHHPNV